MDKPHKNVVGDPELLQREAENQRQQMGKYGEVLCTEKMKRKPVTMVGMVQAYPSELVLLRAYHSFYRFHCSTGMKAEQRSHIHFNHFLSFLAE